MSPRRQDSSHLRKTKKVYQIFTPSGTYAGKRKLRARLDEGIRPPKHCNYRAGEMSTRKFTHLIFAFSFIFRIRWFVFLGDPFLGCGAVDELLAGHEFIRLFGLRDAVGATAALDNPQQ